jgi:MFS family permease
MTDVSLSGSGGLREFYRDMTPPERKTFWACAGGWGFDGLDFTIYPLVIGTIMTLWGVPAGLAGLAATSTLLASAAGGWLAGYCSDRFGRVRTLQVCILWFSLCTLLCAVAQDFEQLLIFRTLLGLGFGGEWAAGAVLMGETIRAQYRGRALGCVQSAWSIGWGAAVLLQALAFSFFPPETAWRAMFVFGFFPALFLLIYIHRNVEEPSIAVRARAAAATVGKPPIWEIFSPAHIKTTLLASLALTGAQGGYYTITTWLPTYLKADRGVTVVASTGYLALLIVGGFIGYLVGAWVSDRYGRRILFLVFSLGAMIMAVVYTQLDLSPVLLFILGFPLGFFSTGYYAGTGAFLTELFPTRLRGSGQGFCFSFGRGIGALFPTLVGYLSGTFELGNAMAVFAVIAYGTFFLTAFALPETKGRVLEPDVVAVV